MDAAWMQRSPTLSSRVDNALGASTSLSIHSLASTRHSWRHRADRQASTVARAQQAQARTAAAKPIKSLPLEDALPLYVALDKDVMRSPGSLAYAEALCAGLKALKVLGITGIAVDVHWGLVEGAEPGLYDWTGYRTLFRLISDFGFKIKVSLCFHSTDSVPLPEWIVEEGRANPDIYFTDKAGSRSSECLTLGIDDVPVLRGRTAVDVYSAFMCSFKEEFGNWFGSTITECLLGLGPNSELKYPAHPLDKRWNFPGVGEFQCYDKFMLANLKACADQASQPSWGLGGPHDAGSYCLWPHQTGFFHQHGSWNTPYGKFFLQWYSEMLATHADEVLSAARDVFADCPLRLSVRVPGNHWWFNTASHGPELTAGYYNTGQRDGYLPIFKAVALQGAGLRLSLAELRNKEQPQQAFCDPERMLAHQRTVAASLQMPVTVENRLLRFDDGAMQRLESVLFDPLVNQSIELPQPAGIVFNCMTDAMFEPANWRSFKSFVIRVRDRAEEASVNARPNWAGASMDRDNTQQGKGSRGRPVFA